MRRQSATAATVFIAVLLLLLSLNTFAAGIRFEPAAPDTRSWITAHVYSHHCGPVDPQVTVTGDQIDIWVVETGGCLAVGFFYPLQAQIGILPPGVYRVRVYGGQGSKGVDEDFLVVRDTRLFRAVPAGAPSTGGATVELKRTTGGSWRSAAIVTVQFGDAPPVAASRSTIDTVYVKVPPHPPGVVNVTVRETFFGTTETVAGAAFTYYDPAAPPDRTVFEPLLFPIAYDGPGAFGSQWTTENWLSPGGATFFAPPCSGCPTTGRERVRLDTVNSPAGVVLWPARGMFETLGASSRVRDLTKQADNAGAYVPVVREGDFRPYLNFPDVPNDTKYRVMLRVWSLEEPHPEWGANGVTWRSGNNVVGTVDLKSVAAPGMSFGSADITAQLHAISGTSTPLTVNGTRRIWGIISVTNNETQQVTIIAPRSGVAGER